MAQTRLLASLRICLLAAKLLAHAVYAVLGSSVCVMVWLHPSKVAASDQLTALAVTVGILSVTWFLVCVKESPLAAFMAAGASGVAGLHAISQGSWPLFVLAVALCVFHLVLIVSLLFTGKDFERFRAEHEAGLMASATPESASDD
jgi:hypothetical protein